MEGIVNKLAKLLETVASYGAGVTSNFHSYQPKTPKCLLDEDQD